MQCELAGRTIVGRENRCTAQQRRSFAENLPKDCAKLKAPLALDTRLPSVRRLGIVTLTSVRTIMTMVENNSKYGGLVLIYGMTANKKKMYRPRDII